MSAITTNGDDICNRLPFPIAHHAARCRSRRAVLSPEGLFIHLAYALEALTRYLALIAVSDYLQQGAFEQHVNNRLQQHIGRKIALGTWLELLREIVRAFVSHDKQTKLPGMVSLIFENSRSEKHSKSLRNLEDLIAWRNSIAHPDQVPDLVGQIDRRYREFCQLLQELAFLADFELIVPLSFAKGNPGIIVVKLVCMGDRQFVAEKTEIELPESLRADVVLDESPLLLDPSRTRALMVLYPFVLFDIEPQEELYGFLHSTWKEGFPYSATFSANQSRVPPLNIRYGESPARDQILKVLGRVLSFSLGVEAISASSQSQRSFEMTSVETEKAYHLETFVGRFEQADALSQWIGERDRGYVFYEAATGSGKSAYASFLMRNRNWPGHLAKRENDRHRPERFLQYLVWQLMERHGLHDHIPTQAGSLAEVLFGLLAKISERLQPLAKAAEVIVFDGLNELDSTTDLSFFPSLLPPRIFFVILSQDCPSLNCLIQRVMVNRAAFTLTGLADTEVHRLFDLLAPDLPEHVRRKVIERAKGWPLYLRRVLDALQSGGAWIEVSESIPESIEALYQRVIDQACAASDPKLVSRTLGVLWASKEPLELQALADILGESKRTIREVVDPLRPCLLSVNRQLSIYHDTFREYVAQELFRPGDARRFQEAFVRWCTPTI